MTRWFSRALVDKLPISSTNLSCFSSLRCSRRISEKDLRCPDLTLNPRLRFLLKSSTTLRHRHCRALFRSRTGDPDEYQGVPGNDADVAVSGVTLIRTPSRRYRMVLRRNHPLLSHRRVAARSEDGNQPRSLSSANALPRDDRLHGRSAPRNLRVRVWQAHFSAQERGGDHHR